MSLFLQSQKFLDLVLNKARDRHGLIRSYLTYPEGDPLTPEWCAKYVLGNEYEAFDDTILGDHFGLPWHQYYMYEDANWCAGRLIVSQANRYRATNDISAKVGADAGFEHLSWVWERGLEYEPGWVAKPYGGMRNEYAIDKCYHETSVDQTIMPGLGVWRYAVDFGDKDAVEKAGRYLAAQADWWIRNDYKYVYAGVSSSGIGAAAHGQDPENTGAPYASDMKVMVPMHAAYKLTGEKRFLKEVKKRIGHCIDADVLKLKNRHHGEIKEWFLWAETAEYFLLESELAGDADWLGLIDGYWRAAKTAINPDYTFTEMGYFNADTWSLERYKTGASNNMHALGGWQTDVKNNWITALFASLATLAYKYRLDEEAGELCLKILGNMDEDHIVRNIDEDGDKLRESVQYRTHITCIETVTSWMDAYWRARLVGILDE